VTKVGNPALSRTMHDADPRRAKDSLGAGGDDPVLLVLPGSRPSEVERLMAPFGQAVALLKQTRPNLRIALAVAPSVADAIRAQAAQWTFEPHLVEGEGAKRDAMRAETVALACSGTVTTELAMAGCPMVVAYKVSPLSAILIRLVIRTRFATLMSIASGRAIVPEFIQKHCNGPELAAALAERLDDPRLRASQIADQTAALALLGPSDGPDPSQMAADAVIGLLAARTR
jgi:lipid-A-disaccharide synthase